MGSILREDPLGCFNFYITLLDTSDVLSAVISAVSNYAVAGFSECSGLDASMETLEFREGGQNTFVHKFATRATYSNITLKRGVIYQYDDLWTWYYSWVQGIGTRKDGLISLLDEGRNPLKVWKFTRAIPTKWLGPSLNASQSNVAIESLEMVHEGLTMEVGA
ncbi:MAG: phage tail protein [Candidatus Cybelea sp.]